MSRPVLLKTYDAPPICEWQVLRYAGMKGENSEVSEMLKSCIKEAESVLSYKVCYSEYDLKIQDNVCSFGDFSLESENLAKNLENCDKTIVFAATVGVGIDRLIAKFGRITPAKLLLADALGSERIEALCDAFSEDIKRETGAELKSRFSPGYGDLDLSAQRMLFAVLDPTKRIGLTLSDSLIMSPSKSVTAIIGLYKGAEKTDENKCNSCGNKNCEFRR